MPASAGTDPGKFLETTKLRPAYCLEGADQWKLDVSREALMRAVGGSDPGFHAEKYDLGEVPLAGALELLRAALGDLNTAPMFAPKKLVFLSGLERMFKRMRMGTSESSRGAEEEESAEESPEVASLAQLFVQAVESYLRHPSPYGVVVFEAEKLDKRKALGKLLSDPKLCMLVDVSSAASGDWDRAGESGEASRTMAAMARGLGVVLKGSALAELAESVEGDLGLARSALLKLRDYIAPRTEILPADVAELVPEARSGIIFDLLAALASGKRQQGLTLMRNLYSRGERGPKIIGGLRWVCEVLLRVKELADRGRERDAYRIRGFAPRAGEFLAVANQLSADTLISWMLLLAETDRALKSSPPDEEVVLEVLAARLTGALENAKEHARLRRALG